MTPQTLLGAGYTQFHDRMAEDSLGEWYRASYQKRVRDKFGTRYFITIRHSVIPAMFGNPQRNSFAPENQFTKDGTTFNVEMLHHNESVEQVEAFFDHLWTTLRLDYYERESDERAQPRQPDFCF